jgi:glycosyltransferase involved in cell wall biosynthesis
MWIVSQIGAREHYCIPQALKRAGQLAALITDFWVPPGSLSSRIPGTRRLSERYHADLVSDTVYAPNVRMLQFEVCARLRKMRGWDVIIARNALFQQKALSFLRNSQPQNTNDEEPMTVFSYSYAALELFREAKRRGWKTVLGQIDPGPREDALVQSLRTAHSEWAGAYEASPPSEYWDLWREECDLADRILVNSAWSQTLLIEAGVDQAKIEIVPLALEKTNSVEHAANIASDSHKKSPLRLLFLGQAIVRKGIQDLVGAARSLREGKWIIDVVGPHGPLPTDLPDCIHFHGAIPRSEVAKWYGNADVFVLPTHSDGFALTQLEAMNHGLPVIATPCCGAVVEDGVNGWVIPPGEPEILANLLKKIANNPEALYTMRRSAKETVDRYGLETVTNALLNPKKESAMPPAKSESQ